MFQNSNSLPIALIQSLVIEVPGLRWDEDDSKDQMLGRALTYLVLYSTLGMTVGNASEFTDDDSYDGPGESSSYPRPTTRLPPRNLLNLMKRILIHSLIPAPLIRLIPFLREEHPPPPMAPAMSYEESQLALTVDESFGVFRKLLDARESCYQKMFPRTAATRTRMMNW